MRAPLVLLALLLAGCASPGGHMREEWTFTQRAADGAAEPIAGAEGFVTTIDLLAGREMRQIGGQWHGHLAAGEPVTLRFESTVNMTLEWRARAGAAGASGRCDWGPEGASKEVPLGVAKMSNTSSSCELVFTPNAELHDPEESPFRWEARTAEPQRDGWALRFEARRG